METRKDTEFARLLREKGFKATSGRLQLLETLKSAKKPLSVETLVEKLEMYMDQATVYRAVEALVTAGIVRRIDLGHTHAHYELVTDEHHHHVICESCGKIEDVELSEPRLERAALVAAPGFAQVRSHSLEFFGTCRSCVTL